MPHGRRPWCLQSRLSTHWSIRMKAAPSEPHPSGTRHLSSSCSLWGEVGTFRLCCGVLCVGSPCGQGFRKDIWGHTWGETSER